MYEKTEKPAQNYVLIGFMGSGKTTVGKQLALRYGLCFCDLDERLEKTTGMTVSELFRSEGEEGFRARETAQLRELAAEAGKDAEAVLNGESGSGAAPGTVYSTGGGIILRQDNGPLLRQIGEVIWLRIRPETVLKRLKNNTTRPLMQVQDRDTKVRSMIAEREPLYRRAADRIIDTDELLPDEIAERIRNGKGECSK
jgi:shikimate kinase